MPKYTDIRDILAYALSVALYPLFVSTYIMVVFCRVFSANVLPLTTGYQALAIGGTLFFTCILPFFILLTMIKMGRVKNLDVTDRKERAVPYLYTMGCVGCWCYFLHIIHMPHYIVWSAVASLAVLVIVMIVTLWWKISVHLSSMGGAVAMVMGIMMQCGAYNPITILMLLTLSWLLMLARIRLDAHTPAQTVAGFLLGLTVVMIPNILFAYAL